MTTLDKHALEKAIEAFNGGCGIETTGRRLEWAIHAYLAALPEARRYWAWQPFPDAPPSLWSDEKTARLGLLPSEPIYEVEIREVRQP